MVSLKNIYDDKGNPMGVVGLSDNAGWSATYYGTGDITTHLPSMSDAEREVRELEMDACTIW